MKKIGLTADTVSTDDGVPFTGSLKAFGPVLYRCGAAPYVLMSIPEKDYVEHIVSQMDGIILTGGSGVNPIYYGEVAPVEQASAFNEERDRFELLLIEACRREGKPILAICRGMQMLNVACGGSVIRNVEQQRKNLLPHRQQPDNYHTASHEITIESDSILYQWMGSGIISVNSIHSNAVERIADGLRVVARAPDGLPEALEAINGESLLAVQWHPELMAEQDTIAYRLFQKWVQKM